MAEKSLHILLVENDQVDSMAIKRFIAKHDLPYILETSETLARAVHLTQKSRFDVILMDYILDDGTGLDILSKVEETPVILITGNGNENIAVEAMRKGAYDYLIKDHDRNYLKLLPLAIQNVLAHKQAKMAKIESEKRYRTIVETVSDIIFQLDANQKVTFVNSAIRDLGYDPVIVVGQRLEEFLHAEDHGKIGLIATRRVGARATRNLEVRFRSKEGNSQWLEIQGVAILLDSYGLWSIPETSLEKQEGEKAFIGTLCIGRNITKRKQAEEALRESETRLRAIMDNVADAIITISKQGIIESLNLAGERIFGYAISEIVGKKFNSLLADGQQGKHDTDFKGFFGDGDITLVTMKSCEVMGRRKDGSSFPMDLSITPMQLKNQELFTGIIRDTTNRKRAEEKLKQAVAELERSNQELQNFASIASHDLQEPLRKIITFGGRLRDVASNLDEQGQNYLQRMQKSAERMQRFIDDLLIYSRVTAKAREFETVDLNKIIKEVLMDLEVRVAQVKGTVNVANLPTLMADPVQMGQLFQNLIGNALKFHKNDTPPFINLNSSRGDNGFWKIVVEDNGIGLDEKYSDRIFKAFERLHGRSSYEGSGMGLTICQKIVVRHNGKIEVKSAVSQGATFYITLPEKQPPPS